MQSCTKACICALCQDARALTHPAETRESDPSTTPPSNSMARMVVCKHNNDVVCVCVATSY